MGYSTSYTLSVIGGDEMAIIAELREKYDSAAYALDEDGTTSESSKWYEHEEEVKAFSLDHPESLFTLNGIGEESPDVWVKYFKNGKMQVSRAEIILAPFDESKLT